MTFYELLATGSHVSVYANHSHGGESYIAWWCMECEERSDEIEATYAGDLLAKLWVFCEKHAKCGEGSDGS